MELHSYAKRKAAKKWTIEQKRKLVEARIAHDGIFAKKPLNCLVTWKKIVSLAKLEDFNVTFVRKQWANMVVKYKQYKRSRLGSTATNAIDDELLRRITEEWEFFRPIHEFMSRKITNLHSYALTAGQKQKQSTSTTLTQQQQQEQDENNASLASQLEKMLASSHDNNHGSSPEIEPGQDIATFSSDTNEDYAAAAQIVANEEIKAVSEAPAPAEQEAGISGQHDVGHNLAVESNDGTKFNVQQTQNTDHDFYSKKSPKQRHYYSDDSNAEEEEEASVSRKQQLTRKTNFSSIENGNGHTVNRIKVGSQLKTATKNGFQTKRRKTDADEDGLKAHYNNKPSSSKYCTGARNPATSSHVSPPPQRSAENHQKKPKLSERDKYYRHKRRFNRRLECRFDKLLNVFGQIIKAEYPSINVSPLLGAAVATAGSIFNGGGGLKFPDAAADDYLNGYHTRDDDAASSSSGASSTAEDVGGLNSSNDGDDDDDDDHDDVNGDVLAGESQKNKTAAGKM